jgi:hypothetical protein
MLVFDVGYHSAPVPQHVREVPPLVEEEPLELEEAK